MEVSCDDLERTSERKKKRKKNEALLPPPRGQFSPSQVKKPLKIVSTHTMNHTGRLRNDRGVQDSMVTEWKRKEYICITLEERFVLIVRQQQSGKPPPPSANHLNDD